MTKNLKTYFIFALSMMSDTNSEKTQTAAGEEQKSSNMPIIVGGGLTVSLLAGLSIAYGLGAFDSKDKKYTKIKDQIAEIEKKTTKSEDDTKKIKDLQEKLKTLKVELEKEMKDSNTKDDRKKTIEELLKDTSESTNTPGSSTNNSAASSVKQQSKNSKDKEVVASVAKEDDTTNHKPEEKHNTDQLKSGEDQAISNNQQNQ